MPQPDLLGLIDQAAREKWKTLDLSGMGLTELPPEIGRLMHLTKLVLGRYEQLSMEGAPVIIRRNQLATLPSEIVRLTKLEELDFRFNHLTSLPLEITKLVNLKGLYLSGNQLQDLPLEVEKLVNLESLTLGGNQFNFVPPVIFKIKNLRQLFLDNHSLGMLPSEIEQLLHLEVLSLRNEKLTELPTTLWNLLNLKRLYLKDNQLARLPEELGNLKNLEELDLRNNQLKSLPESIGRLPKLRTLYLRDNQLASLPKTIIRIRKAFVDTEFNFSSFDFSGYDLSDVDLSNTNLSDVILTSVNFKKTNLCNADLSSYDLKGGNLRNANFSYANLTRVRALGTDFSNAIFTGASIKDWHINAETKFDKAVCDYIYLKEDQQERRPSDLNRNFAPGEFVTLIQEIRETVDLIFTSGIDWAALLTSIRKLQVASGDNQLTIQAIEHKRDGRFVVRVDIPPNVDKAEIEQLLWREYENKLKSVEETYLQKIESKSEQLDFYKQQVIEYRSQNSDLMEMAKQMANRPLQIENKIENRNVHQEEKNQTSTINQHGLGDNVAGDKVMGNKIDTQIDNSHDLVQSSKDIKALLDQLSVDYPSDSPRLVGAKAVDQVEKNPELKSRILRGVRAGSFAALEKMIDHPVAKFFIEGIKEVLKP